MRKFLMLVLALLVVIVPCQIQAETANYYEFIENGGSWSDGFWMYHSNGTSAHVKTLTHDGDSTLITLKNTGGTVVRVLVDAGNDEKEVADKLRAQNITTLNYCIISHNHIDHYNGLKGFYASGKKRITINHLYVSSFEKSKINSVLSNLGSKDTIVIEPVNHAANGEAVTQVGSYTWLIHPIANFTNYKFTTPGGANSDAANGNNASMMVVVKTSIAKVVLGCDIYPYTMLCLNQNKLITATDKNENTGEITYFGDTYLCSNYLDALYTHVFNDNSRYCVYKVPHHGIRTYYDDKPEWENKVTSFALPNNQNQFYSLYQNWYLIEKELFAKIQPDVIVTTGNSMNTDDEKYFDEIEAACIEGCYKGVNRRYSFDSVY